MIQFLILDKILKNIYIFEVSDKIFTYQSKSIEIRYLHYHNIFIPKRLKFVKIIKYF